VTHQKHIPVNMDQAKQASLLQTPVANTQNLGPQSFLCPDCRTAIDRWGSEKDISHAGDGRPSHGPPETLLAQSNTRLIDRVAIGCRLCTMVYDSYEGETRSFLSTTFRSRRNDLKEGEPAEVWGYMTTWRSGGPPNEKYDETDISIRRWRPQVDMHFGVRLHRVAEKGCTGRKYETISCGLEITDGNGV